MSTKSQHGKELRDFRREIEGHVSQWALIENDADRMLIVEEGVCQFEERVRDISEMMRRSRWLKLDFGVLCTIVGSGVAGWSAAATGDVGVGLLGASLSLAPVVYDAFRGADRQVDPGPLVRYGETPPAAPPRLSECSYQPILAIVDVLKVAFGSPVWQK